MTPRPDDECLRPFFRMVANISNSFGKQEEILYVVDKKEKSALETAKGLLENYLAELADREATPENAPPNQPAPAELLTNVSSKNTKGRQVEEARAWNETRTNSGCREWTLGGVGDGVISDDIFRCVGKKAFESFEAAKTAAVSYTKLKGERFKPYKCPYCSYHHIGGDR